MMALSSSPSPSPSPSSVLVCCNLNSARSAMAEGVLQLMYGDQLFIDSVGVEEGKRDEFAVAVMSEVGVDIEHHAPKAFDSIKDSSFDIIIALTPEAREKVRKLTRTAAATLWYWPTDDPAEVQGSRDQRLEAYRQVRDSLIERISKAFPTPEDPGRLLELE